MKQQETIEAGRRVAAFLAEPAIVAALATMKEKHYGEFMTAATRDAIDKAHSKARLMVDFEGELRAIVEAGEFEAAKKLRAERTQAPARR